AAIRKSISIKEGRAVAAVADRGKSEAELPRPKPQPATAATKTQSITVPIMGEGIRSAKVVALLKKPGDPIELDDALCEVETDKAVYPIESSFAGTMGQWKVEVGATVEIGQELGTILVEGGRQERTVEAAVSAAESVESGRHARRYTIEPALSP